MVWCLLLVVLLLVNSRSGRKALQRFGHLMIRSGCCCNFAVMVVVVVVVGGDGSLLSLLSLVSM